MGPGAQRWPTRRVPRAPDQATSTPAGENQTPSTKAARSERSGLHRHFPQSLGYILRDIGRSNRQGASRHSDWPSVLFDDFNDAVRARIDKNRSAVDDGVAIIAHAIFLRNVIVGHANAGQICALPHVAVVRIGRVMPLDHIAMKTRPLIDPEYAIYPTDNTANGSPNDSANRACCPLTFARARAMPPGTP